MQSYQDNASLEKVSMNSSKKKKEKTGLLALACNECVDRNSPINVQTADRQTF